MVCAPLVPGDAGSKSTLFERDVRGLCSRAGRGTRRNRPIGPNMRWKKGWRIYLLQFKDGTWTDVLGRGHLQYRH
jgi:hypothetical protein